MVLLTPSKNAPVPYDIKIVNKSMEPEKWILKKLN